MAVSLDKIKELRERTGVSIAQCKEALEEAGEDIQKAIVVLRKKGIDAAAGKTERETKEGIVASYIHGNNKVGAMLELLCETDFVARNEEFQKLGKELAMQVTATNPVAVSPDQISEDKIQEEADIYKEQLKGEGKPAEIIEKALEGKLKKYKEEKALLTQPYIKDPEITVEEVVKEAIGKLGENIQIGEFKRFEI